MGSPGEIVYSGGLWLALPIALAAGLISFLSPCVLPLVPGYLGFVSGVTSGKPQSRGRMVAGAGLFVLGFSVVFLLAFLVLGSFGTFLLRWQDMILRVAGVVVILLGIVFIGQISFLQRTIKSSWQPRTGLIGAPLLGVVFAVGWTPCIGPTLVAAQSLALNTGDVGRSLLIGAAYCIGLGLPFLLVALGFGWVGTSVRWVRRHIRLVNIIGGVLLIAIGLLMVTGLWLQFTTSLGAVIDDYVPTL
ncbi:cytochrome c biogenesis CcdA family protein [Schumannella soli]|uniref:Cytochrome c biogenesis protein CcdA n=1 Tax=Schumannella soli TaxID=2590779 RepID=A0A506XVC7_9MICO|nr:cytochrome c biogenesis CcdA family protein [Schumannella soli]TPW74116.1 cytochrome c biogenesis protein CcdA [Schumannella soli]